MNSSILRKRILDGLILAILSVGVVAIAGTPASAAVFRVYVDADNSTATGCPGGSFSGIEQILVTTVDTTPQVTTVQQQTCTGGAFGPLTNVGPPNPPWAVGVGNGLSGTDIVETFLPFTPVGPDVRLYVTSAPDAAAPVSDSMTTRAPGAGAPIVLGLPFAPTIPTLGEWGLLLLVLLLGGTAVTKLRKRQRHAFLLLCLLAGGATAAFAAIVLDGQASDWGTDQPIAEDTLGGSGETSPDLRALFVRFEEGKLFFRIDTTLSAPQTITFTSTPPAGATVGGPTYNVTATATSGLPVDLTIDPSANSVCTIAGSTVSFIGTGTCTINANQPGDGSFDPAPQVQQSFPVGQGNQTITFTSAAPASATAGGPTYTVMATATSGLPVTFAIDASAASVCSIAGSTVSFIGAGTCVINANQAGDASWNPAPQAQQSFAVGQGNQTITFTSTAPAGAQVGGPTYTVTATATSGLPVAFTIDASATSVCSIAGSTVSFLAIGNCVINANQAGDANWNPAPQVQQSFAVGQGDQTISFTSTAPASAQVGGPTYTVTATATSGLAVAFTIDPSATSVCSIAGSTVSFLALGNCVINANQAGDANWNAAPQVQQTFAVGKGDQTISFTSTAPAAAQVGDPAYTVTATATSGLTVAFTIDPSATSVCSIAGSAVSFLSAGTCVINANQAGDANWNAAPQVQQSFAVGRGDQTISFTSTAPVGAQVGGPTYTVTATATSGLAVAFTIDPSAASVCSIAGSTVSFIGVGNCVINANQAGDANWNAAPQVQQSFAVARGDQTITYTSTAPVNAQVGGATYTVTATATSGLAVAFTIDPSAASVCSIAGSTVSFIGVGNCVINANQAGDANWNAAPQVQQSFAVARGDQTITYTSTAPVNAQVGGATYTVTATATSGLAVAFTIDPSAASVCSIAGSTVSFIGVGNCVINANQAGNANWNPAPQAQQSFAVARGDQTITFTSPAPINAQVGGPTYTVTATATSGLPVTFAIDPSAASVCSIAGSTVSFMAMGTCVINANQAGNANWNPAPQAQQSFTVARGDQTITFTSPAPAGAAVNGPTYNVTATASSGLPVTFSIDPSAASVCSIAGSTVSFIGAGTCVINANQAGNANYNAAPQVQQSFAVARGNQTIAFTSLPPADPKVSGSTYTVTATATSGLPVTFTIDPSAASVCSIAGSTVSFIGAGTCVINANQAGNANWNAAPQVQQSFLVTRNDQSITFTSTPPTNATPGGPTYTVTAVATSGLPVTFTIDPSSAGSCSIAGSTVSFLAGGTCVINANQAGNFAYNPAPQVQQSFHVNFPPQLIASPRETFDTIGNTRFEFKAAQASAPSVWVTGNLVANFTDPDNAPVTPLAAIAIVGGATANGGTVDVATNGEFTYTPPAGSTLASDTFQYQVTDGLATVTRTVTLRRVERVWYVRNNATAGGLGRSNDPFDTLAEAQTASVANDYIFVYFGNGTSSGQDQGIVLKNGQHLIGHYAGLSVSVTTGGTFNGSPVPFTVSLVTQPTPLATACAGLPCRPLVDNPAAGGNAVSATDAIPAAIVALSLSGTTNAIDITTNAAFAGSGDLSIRDNVIRSTGIEGIDVNAAGTGALNLAISDNNVTAGLRGIDVLRTAGTVRITGFANNVITGTTGGSGMEITGVLFDSTPSNVDTSVPVSGGATVIGQSGVGGGAGTNGMLLTNVTGNLQFTDLDIWADAGTGLGVIGTGALNAAVGTGFRIAVSGTVLSPVASINATNGPAVSINNASVELPLVDLLSSGSTTTGVSLVNAFGPITPSATLSALSGLITDPAGASGVAFNVDGGAGDVSFAGPITSNSGRSISITNRDGAGEAGTFAFSALITENAGSGGIFLDNNDVATLNFSGGITSNTTTNPGFTATNGGTVNVTNTNTLTTTTGTGLNVANTTIGASNLNFQSISTNGATNGIVLNATGTTGRLIVSGTGSAGSGGTIRNGATGISLTNTRGPEFNRMQLNDFTDFAIRGTSVVNFTLANSVINGTNGNDAGADEGSMRFSELTGTASVTNTNISGAVETNFAVVNTTGSLNRLTVTGSTFGLNSTATGADGLFVEGQGTATVNVTAQNNFFTAARDNPFQLNLTGTASADLVFTGNAVSNNHPAIVSGGGGVVIAGGGAGSNVNLTYNIANNTLRDSRGAALSFTKGSGTGVFSGTITNNQIGVAAVVDSGSAEGSGISIIMAESGSLDATVTGNSIRQYGNYGLYLQAGGTSVVGNGALRATVTGNTISNPGTLIFTKNGIHLNSGTLAGDTYATCVNIGGAGALANSLTGTGTDGGTDFRLRQRQTTTVRLPGYGGANNDDAAVVAFVAGRNGGASGSATNTSSGWLGGAACP